MRSTSNIVTQDTFPKMYDSWYHAITTIAYKLPKFSFQLSFLSYREKSLKTTKSPKVEKVWTYLLYETSKGIEPVAFAKNVKNVRPSYNFLFVALLPVVFGEKLSKSKP